MTQIPQVESAPGAGSANDVSHDWEDPDHRASDNSTQAKDHSKGDEVEDSESVTLEYLDSLLDESDIQSTLSDDEHPAEYRTSPSVTSDGGHHRREYHARYRRKTSDSEGQASSEKGEWYDDDAFGESDSTGSVVEERWYRSRRSKPGRNDRQKAVNDAERARAFFTSASSHHHSYTPKPNFGRPYESYSPHRVPHPPPPPSPPPPPTIPINPFFPAFYGSSHMPGYSTYAAYAPGPGPSSPSVSGSTAYVHSSVGATTAGSGSVPITNTNSGNVSYSYQANVGNDHSVNHYFEEGRESRRRRRH